MPRPAVIVDAVWLNSARKMFYPMCRTCGWSMCGLDSWDGNRCRCGTSVPGVPLDEVMKWGEE